MTAGHKHRIVVVKHGGLVHRVLTRPTLALVPPPQAERSAFAYGPADKYGMHALTPLGVLHGLCGLTLETKPRHV